MPGNACCSGRDTASMTESPTGVMSLPGIAMAVRLAVLGLALAGLAVLAFPPVTALWDRPSASALAPCEIWRCMPLGAADGLIGEQPEAQATTIAPSARPLIAVCVLDNDCISPESLHWPGSHVAPCSFPGWPAGKRRPLAFPGNTPEQ